MIPFITIGFLLCLIFVVSLWSFPLFLCLRLLGSLFLGLLFLPFSVLFDAPEIGLMRSYISHLPLVRAPLV